MEVAPKMVSTRVVKTVIAGVSAISGDAEVNVRAFAAADPVALHGADFFRPAVGMASRLVEEFVRILA